MKHNKGFTIVEIAVVVVIIAILATLTLVAYNRVQANAHNDSSNSKGTVISEALEKYYTQNGEYPTCALLTQSSTLVTTNVLKGLDSTILNRYGSPAGTNNINCTALDTTGFYYTPGSDSYTLQYKEEYTGNTITFSSHHSAQNEAPAGSPTITLAQSGTNTVATASASCKTGYSVQYAYKYQVNDGAWGSYGAWTASSTNTQAGTSGYKYVVQVKTQCTNSTTTAESGQSNSVVMPVAAPSSVIVSINNSGANMNMSTAAVSCPSGTTAQYQYTYKDEATANTGAWTSWTAWSTTTASNTHTITDGWRTVFQVYALCHGNYVDSGIVASGEQWAIRPMNTPAAPTWAGVGSFRSGTSSNIYQYPGTATYNTYCPYGSWITGGSNTFDSHAQWDSTKNYVHNYPYNDYWYNQGLSGTQYVDYYARYTCATGFSSATSLQSHNVLAVTP